MSGPLGRRPFIKGAREHGSAVGSLLERTKRLASWPDSTGRMSDAVSAHQGFINKLTYVLAPLRKMLTYY